MAQAKKKTATRTRKTTAKRATGSWANTRSRKQMQKGGGQQQSNTFFVITMTALAATLLLANLVMIAG